MKFLIYLGCFIVLALVQTLIKEAGIILGGIPTAILFYLTYSIAHKLSSVWEAKHSTKTEEPQTCEEVVVSKEPEELPGPYIPLSIILPILGVVFVVILAIIIILERS